MGVLALKRAGTILFVQPQNQIFCWFFFLQNDLREKKEIKLFRLGKESDAFAIVFTDNYRDHIRKTLADSPAKERFLETVIEKSSDVSLDQKTMTDFGFKDEEIT